jgi:hydrogenase expression/formation protein HypE
MITHSNGRIALAHGGGGQLTDELLDQRILPRLGNVVLNELLDSAALQTDTNRIAMTIDSYVVEPWQFPGGDIGRLAVCGTVNDLAVSGAQPLGIALSLIMAEGFAMRDLETVLDSVARAAREASVRIVTGDTKVIGAEHGRSIFITTAGVGQLCAGPVPSPTRVEPGDAILINGPIADHGVAVMLAREMPEVQSVLRSDAAPLNGLIAMLIDAVGDVPFMRDPTRSGVAGVCADLARQSGRHVTLDERNIPVRPETRHAADMLGLDPLEVANEGKVIAVVPHDAVEAAMDAMRDHPLGRQAAMIGRVGDEADGVCELMTVIGGRRVIQKPYGEQLPRIC